MFPTSPEYWKTIPDAIPAILIGLTLAVLTSFVTAGAGLSLRTRRILNALPGVMILTAMLVLKIPGSWAFVIAVFWAVFGYGFPTEAKETANSPPT